MKKIISLALMAFALLPTSALAQEDDNDFKAHVQADFISHYMWRGTDMGGISIQPELGISWRGFSLGVFGNAGFDKDDIKELDITLGYENSGFNIGITDYWASGTDPEDRYFFYKDKETAHQWEANIGYTCKYGSIQAYTMFAGNDYKANGDRAYSTYVELSVPFRLGNLDWDARVGITPKESAEYEKFTCNMASLRATKSFEFKHLELPVFAELHANPYLQKAQFLVGVSFKVF